MKVITVLVLVVLSAGCGAIYGHPPDLMGLDDAYTLNAACEQQMQTVKLLAENGVVDFTPAIEGYPNYCQNLLGQDSDLPHN